MSARALFDRERAVYWPTEYVDLVNVLKGMGAGGKATHAPLYKFNTGIIVLAAVTGLVHTRVRDVGPAKQEIRDSRSLRLISLARTRGIARLE